MPRRRKHAQYSASGCKMCGDGNVGRGIAQHVKGAHDVDYDAYQACWRDGKFGVGVGSIVLFINPTLLALYTFGCHAWRHLIGGRLNCFSCADGAAHFSHGAWNKVSWLNARHMRFAWISLFWVGFTDLYVRLLSMGYIADYSTWG